LTGPRPRQISRRDCVSTKDTTTNRYDQWVEDFGFIAHIRARGEETLEVSKGAGFRARRWVVERTHSWMNRFRGLLIRWPKKAANYLACLHFVCGIIAWRSAGLLG
jgi:transposase